MRREFRQAVAIGLCELLVFLPVIGDAARQEARPRPAETTSLRDYLQKPYLELFELAPKLEFSAEEIQNQRQAFQNGEKVCVTRFTLFAARKFRWVQRKVEWQPPPTQG